MFTIHTLKLPNISSNRLLFDLAFLLKRVNNPKSWTRKKKKIEIFDERCFSVYMEKNRIRQSPTEIRLNKYITFDESFSHFYSCFNWYHIYNGVNKRRVKKAESHTQLRDIIKCCHATMLYGRLSVFRNYWLLPFFDNICSFVYQTLCCSWCKYRLTRTEPTYTQWLFICICSVNGLMWISRWIKSWTNVSSAFVSSKGKIRF